MMLLKLCGGALLCVTAILLLRGAGRQPWPLQWGGQLLLVGAALLLLEPVFSYFGELCRAQGMGETMSLLLRGLGVAFLAQTCADLCRQCGEGSLAAGVELTGKAELLLLCLPLLRDLVEVAQDLLGGL